MKEIKAFVQPFEVSEVIDALQAIPGMRGITLLHAEGFGRGRGKHGVEVAATGALHHLARAMLLMMVPDALASTVIATIEKTAHTGNPGDGKIFVTPLEEAVRISSGTRGETAL